jgi:hypothetical protein
MRKFIACSGKPVEVIGHERGLVEVEIQGRYESVFVLPSEVVNYQPTRRRLS